MAIKMNTAASQTQTLLVDIAQSLRLLAGRPPLIIDGFDVTIPDETESGAPKLFAEDTGAPDGSDEPDGGTEQEPVKKKRGPGRPRKHKAGVEA